MFNIYLDSALLVLAFMHIVMLIAFFKKDNGIVDVFWGLGFTVVAIFVHLYYPHPYSWLTMLLVAIWGFRLAIHIGVRNAWKKEEDWRYANWRKDWGKWFYLRSYLQVFLLQGFFMWIILLPVLQRPGVQSLQWFQYIGIVLWLFGLLWESIGDWQLFKFKKDPENKGKILTKGLWALSRHPNYFGEAVLWWGIALFVLPWGIWYLSLLGALTITYLLTRVSGVPFLEWKYRDNPAYLEYIRTTPAFVPKLF
ncbi:MAG: DUF1295 domain-containing protein [Saprospiraceae bacterium]